MAGLTPRLPLNINTVDGAYTLIKNRVALVRQNFKNLVLTAPGERMMIPDFGVGLRNFLFENDTYNLREAIIDRISVQTRKYMPFVQIVSIDIFPNPENDLRADNSLNIHIKYAIPSLQTTDILEISV